MVSPSEKNAEVMWRQYELPTNIRTMQFADPTKVRLQPFTEWPSTRGKI